MTESPLINIGDLAEPATVLIEKVSDAIGGAFKPYQIKRVATAEVEAEKIRALGQVEVNEIQQRALIRFVAEETKKQSNIEAITYKAINDLDDDANPQDVEDDWITNFFDKCRLISDEQMQTLWASVLAGEANNPGKYSKRTVNFLSSIDKSDALLFSNLCSFGWFLGNVIPLIFNVEHEIYAYQGITFDSLKHLDEIGLVSFEPLAGYIRKQLPKTITVHYFETPYNVEFNKEGENSFDIGKILLSQVGQELALTSGAQPIPEFVDYVLFEWNKKDYTVYSEWPRKT